VDNRWAAGLWLRMPFDNVISQCHAQSGTWLQGCSHHEGWPKAGAQYLFPGFHSIVRYEQAQNTFGALQHGRMSWSAFFTGLSALMLFSIDP
jgi:hypothetical protein